MKPLPSMQTGAATCEAVGTKMLTNTSQPSTWPVKPFVPKSDTRWVVGLSKRRKPILLAVPTVTVVAVASEMRAAVATSATTNGGGGMIRSSVETTMPLGVLMVIRPDPALDGTGAVTVVVVEAVGPVNAVLNRAWLFAAVVSKFVPVTVIEVPAIAVVGEKLVIVGRLEAVTVNGTSLVSEPFGLVTDIVPVVAPEGTATTSFVVDAELMDAEVLLNDTVFCPAVALNPVPWIVTV